MNDPLAEVDPAAGIRVKITDLKSSADALYFEDEDGEPVLLIRRLQSFPSAVEGVRDALEIPEEQARAIVRFHHPEAAEWGEQDVSELIATPPARPSWPVRQQQPAVQPNGRPGRHLRLLPRWTVTAIATVAALGAGYSMAGKQAASQATPGTTDGIELADAQPYSSAAFKDFATDGEMACTPTGPLEAKCVDVDGKIMYSEASVGSDWTQFSFTYDEGDKRIGLRVFSNEAAAKLWAQGEGMRESVYNLVQYDRYALWGNDERRLGEYLALLKDQNDPSPALKTTASGRHAGQAESITVAAAKQAQPKVKQPKHAKRSEERALSVPTSPSAPPAQPMTVAQVPTVAAVGLGAPARVQSSERMRTGGHQHRDQAAPMPRRLAVLALGTLGINPAKPPTLAEANTLQEMGTLVAVSIVMGVDPADTGVPVEDIPVLDPKDVTTIDGLDRSTSMTDLADGEAVDGTCAKPDLAAETTVGPELTPVAPATPVVPVAEPPKPTRDKPAEEKPVTRPTAPTAPQQPDPPKTVGPEEPAVPPPSTETPAPETPKADGSEPSVEAPVQEPVLEDPGAEPGESADEDQDIDEGQDDTAVAAPEDGGAPAAETDAGADLVLIPDAWRGDQVA
ncbi:hypothetical protein [Streptomyces rochei]|uniref:hypothetical protein n=1 Tax=Streptomyces rochei TaxID=1928 RepID=UPI0036FD2E33